jgi:hypothetical protein
MIGIFLGSILEKRRDFSVFQSAQTGSSFQPVPYPVGIGSSLPGINRPGREAEHCYLPKDCVDLYRHYPMTWSLIKNKETLPVFDSFLKFVIQGPSQCRAFKSVVKQRNMCRGSRGAGKKECLC